MKKIFSLLLSALLCLSFTACGQSEQPTRQLNLYTWENMFPQELLDAFTEETGIQVNYSNFDTDETMLARLEAAEGGDYDLVLADDYIIETVIAEGLAAELDKEQLSNYENIDPFFQGQFYDPENLYTVPFGSGVQTIVYDPALVDLDIQGYADLWDPSLADSIAITSNYRVMNGMALKIMGESYNTNDVATIQQAGQQLMDLAPNIRLIKDDNVQDDLLSGEVGAAVMYTSQVTIACQQNPDLKVVYPEEGVGFGIMAMFIPSQAANSAEAHEFINYLLRPEVAKEAFQFVGYYCTNQAAYDLIDEDMQNYLILPDEFKSNTEMIENISAEASEAHVQVWTEFRNACGL